MGEAQNNTGGHPGVLALRAQKIGAWLRETPGLRQDQHTVTFSDMLAARQRFERFAPVLKTLFQADGWDGRVNSPLMEHRAPVDRLGTFLLKADHMLPMTGSVKARGGVYELLCHIESIALDHGLIRDGEALAPLLTQPAKTIFAQHRVLVASTGNLGFSIGLVARAFGLQAEIHMSHDAKTWKKERLRTIGAKVVEHPCDYERAVAKARDVAAGDRCYFIDDERSLDLFVGYTTAALELRDQLATRGILISADRPLVVYLPCGVGGAPGGITWGLRALFGDNVVPVFVEPIASACVFVSMAVGDAKALSVYDVGLSNNTIADGLAVPKASQLVLDLVGSDIDAVMALPDQDMTGWVRRAWQQSALRLEPSAASSLAAVKPFMDALGNGPLFGRGVTKQSILNGVHVAWTTGGSLLPDQEFERLVA